MQDQARWPDPGSGTVEIATLQNPIVRIIAIYGRSPKAVVRTVVPTISVHIHHPKSNVQAIPINIHHVKTILRTIPIDRQCPGSFVWTIPIN